MSLGEPDPDAMLARMEPIQLTRWRYFLDHGHGGDHAKWAAKLVAEMLNVMNAYSAAQSGETPTLIKADDVIDSERAAQHDAKPAPMDAGQIGASLHSAYGGHE